MCLPGGRFTAEHYGRVDESDSGFIVARSRMKREVDTKNGMLAVPSKIIMNDA